jgi:hypothetical protein
MLHEVPDLRTGHRVALDRSRVVDVVDQDLAEDLVCLDGHGKAAQVLMKQPHLLVHSREHFHEGRAIGSAARVFPTLCGHRIQ